MQGSPLRTVPEMEAARKATTVDKPVVIFISAAKERKERNRQLKHIIAAIGIKSEGLFVSDLYLC